MMRIAVWRTHGSKGARPSWSQRQLFRHGDHSIAKQCDPVRRRGRLIPYYTTSTPASGELYASAHDLARFAIFNMRHRDKGQAAILSEHDIDELHRPVFTVPFDVASTFGWFMSHAASDVPFYFKSGGDPGVANRMCFVPSKHLAWVVVTNQFKSGELAYGVVDELIANYLPDWRRPRKTGFPSKPFIATSAFRGRWQGLLENDGASTPIQLVIESNEAATLTIGANRAEVITGMRAGDAAFTGLSTRSNQLTGCDKDRSQHVASQVASECQSICRQGICLRR